MGWPLTGLTAGLMPARMHLPAQLDYTPSDSVPRGGYRVEAASELHQGDTVLAQLVILARNLQVALRNRELVQPPKVLPLIPGWSISRWPKGSGWTASIGALSCSLVSTTRWWNTAWNST